MRTKARMNMRWPGAMSSSWTRSAGLRLTAGALLATGCTGRAPAPPPPCDTQCKDNIALRAIRETMRWVYNQKLQGRPVGVQDASASCLMQGRTNIFGDAGSNASQGSTEV